MPMPPDTLKTLQDLEITGAGARATGPQQQQDDDKTQQYGEQQPIEQDGHGHGHGHGRQQQQPAQTIHHLPIPTAAPHPAALQAHPSEQPHSAPFYPPLLDHHFAFDHSDGTLPIDPGLLDARFDHSTVSGPGGGPVPGFHQGHQASHWAAPQPVSLFNMDDFVVSSPTALPQYSSSSAPLQPGMSSFEPLISTTWSMDGSLPSTSTSRGLTMSSSMSVPSTSTPASSRSPGSPRKVGARMSSQPPAAAKDAPLANGYPGMQLEQSSAQDQPNKKRRQTVGPKATGTDKVRSHRNNSSPGFTTPPVPIAAAPIASAVAGDDNEKNMNERKGGGGGSKHQEKTTTKTTTTTSNSAPSGPPPPPGPSTSGLTTASTTTTTTSSSIRTTAAAAVAVPGQPPDPRARNREAANRCRAKSKVAVAELEATERAMGAEHQALSQEARHLRDEVLALKNELLAHGNCDDELIQRYLTNSARMVGSGIAAMGPAAPIVTTTTTTASGGLPGLSLRPPGGSSSSSSRAMLPAAASPPRALPALLPSSSSSAAAGAGAMATRTARGRGGVGGRKP